MDLTNRLKDLEKKLEAQKADLERRTKRMMGDVSARLGKQVSATDASATAGPGAGAASLLHGLTPHSARVDMSRERPLRVLDEVMDNAFEVTLRLGGTMNAYPTTYCESVREYMEPIIGNMPMPDTHREQVLREVEAAAEAGSLVPILSSLGVHIPGVGCFINGWLMARIADTNVKAFFETPKGFAQIMATAAHEKWGHGFITELTALGREKRSVQLDMHHIADQFETRTVDTPDHARLREQWEILFFSSNYVEEGFATWVARNLAEQLVEQDTRSSELLNHSPRFTVEWVVDRLRAGGGLVDALGQAVRGAAENPGADALPAACEERLEGIALRIAACNANELPVAARAVATWDELGRCVDQGAADRVRAVVTKVKEPLRRFIRDMGVLVRVIVDRISEEEFEQWLVMKEVEFETWLEERKTRFREDTEKVRIAFRDLKRVREERRLQKEMDELDRAMRLDGSLSRMSARIEGAAVGIIEVAAWGRRKKRDKSAGSLGDLAACVEQFFGASDARELWPVLHGLLAKNEMEFQWTCGMPAPYVIGYLMMDRIARTHGPKCVPYAVATACNIEYDLKTISNQDLANYVGKHPDLNVNARIVAELCVPSGTPDDVDAFLARVRESVGFAPAQRA